jgi:2'-5' RNA ligase
MERLDALERPERPGLRWTTEAQWHVTLRFFGRVDGGFGVVSPQLAEVAGRWAGGAVRAVAGPSTRRLGDAVWVLPVDGLAPLADAVAAATAEIGEPVPSRPFRGHVTLGRARRPAGLRDLPGGAIEAAWDVEEITLVSSELHPAGARYSIVGRWRLAGG